MKSSILLHLYYQDLWPEFKEKIIPVLNENTHLYVSVNTLESEYIDDIRKYSTDVFLIENRGMDVAPFIYVYNKIKDKNYYTYLKIHSKKSLHTLNIGDNWRKSLYYPILDNYNNILEQVKDINECWMLGVKEYYYDKYRDHSKLAAQEYIDKLCDILNIKDNGAFFAGTMFMVNNIYLKTLFNNINLEKFYNEFEEGYLRDSLAHGMERVIGYGINHYKGIYYMI
jgi:lipopolysaccharide biosynthesis protein